MGDFANFSIAATPDSDQGIYGYPNLDQPCLHWRSVLSSATNWRSVTGPHRGHRPQHLEDGDSSFQFTPERFTCTSRCD